MAMLFENILPNSIEEELFSYFDEGAKEGKYVGFRPLAPYYAMREGSCTDWSGYPISGKTRLVLELLLNMSNFYGWKHALYMPDAGSKVEITAMLIEMASGKTFKSYYYKDNRKIDVVNRITRSEIYNWQEFISQYFIILEPKGARPTPIDFWDHCAYLRKKEKINTGVIDSWNYLRHNVGQGERYDMWLENVLSYRNVLAEKTRLHFHTIIHPKTPEPNAAGEYPVPGEYALKGGSEWFNNAKSLIIVHRASKKDRATKIYVKKCKGVPGVFPGICELYYDIENSRFFTFEGEYKTYAEKDFKYF